MRKSSLDSFTNSNIDSPSSLKLTEIKEELNKKLFSHVMMVMNKSRYEILLKQGANPNIQNAMGFTPLMTMAQFGITSHVETLLKHNANVEAKDKNGKTALIHAANNNRFDVCKLLIQSKANINEVDDKYNSALHYAALFGHYKIVKFLFDNGGDINLLGEWEHTPFSWLINSFQSTNDKDQCNNLISYILDTNKVDINKTNEGSTLLVDALYTKNYVIADKLVAKKVDIAKTYEVSKKRALNEPTFKEISDYIENHYMKNQINDNEDVNLFSEIPLEKQQEEIIKLLIRGKKIEDLPKQHRPLINRYINELEKEIDINAHLTTNISDLSISDKANFTDKEERKEEEEIKKTSR